MTVAFAAAAAATMMERTVCSRYKLKLRFVAVTNYQPSQLNHDNRIGGICSRGGNTDAVRLRSVHSILPPSLPRQFTHVINAIHRAQTSAHTQRLQNVTTPGFCPSAVCTSRRLVLPSSNSSLSELWFLLQYTCGGFLLVLVEKNGGNFVLQPLTLLLPPSSRVIHRS